MCFKSFANYLCLVTILCCYSWSVSKNVYNFDSENNMQKSEEHISDIGSDFEHTSDGAGIVDDAVVEMFGRKVIKKDKVKRIINENGIVTTKICINKQGIVTYVQLLSNETTIKDRENLRLFLMAARNYKFDQDLTAPKEQCGKLKFIIDNSVRRK